MALSKPLDFAEKINNTEWSTGTEITIHEEEIEMFCTYSQDRAISIELILNLLGGPNMDYEAMNVEDSFQCFDFCSKKVIDFLKESKQDILFFEHRKNTTSNILIVATKQPKGRGVREHVVFMAVIRLTLLVTPKVGFCRYINVKGK